MENACRIVISATGCTPEQAQAAIAGLMEDGWSGRSTAPLSATSKAAPSVTPASLSDIPAGTVLTAHADGACSGNPGPGGWAVVFSIDSVVLAEFFGGAADTTNNRMELTAVREAIQRVPVDVSLEVITDSRNVIGWLMDGWKRNEPSVIALCAEIDATKAERASGGGRVTFRHVRGHRGDVLNERADKLATAAIRRA